jgi:hypothetical protein
MARAQTDAYTPGLCRSTCTGLVPLLRAPVPRLLAYLRVATTVVAYHFADDRPAVGHGPPTAAACRNLKRPEAKEASAIRSLPDQRDGGDMNSALDLSVKLVHNAPQYGARASLRPAEPSFLPELRIRTGSAPTSCRV